MPITSAKSINRRIMFWAGLGKKLIPKITKSKKG
jgi:hypothetical protein